MKTIADISRTRLRDAIKKLHAKGNGSLDFNDRETPEDLGFRVYQLSMSHNRQWSGVPDRDAESLGKQMALFIELLLLGITASHPRGGDAR